MGVTGPPAVGAGGPACSPLRPSLSPLPPGLSESLLQRQHMPSGQGGRVRPRRLLPRVQGEPGARAQGRRAGWGPPVPMVILAPWNQVKPAGEPCRPAKDQCDLGEHCDGRWPTCPEDAFRENGAPCPGGYCYNGACPTLAQRCRDLWGPGEAGTAAGLSGRRGWQRSQAGGLTHSSYRLAGGRGDLLPLRHLRRLSGWGPPAVRQVSVPRGPAPLGPGPGMSPSLGPQEGPLHEGVWG